MRTASSIALGALLCFASHLEAGEFSGFTRLKDPDKTSRFGESVAISNDTLVVGDNDPTSGTVWVFERKGDDPTGWKLAKRLSSPTPEEQRYFGRHLDIDSDLLLVGVGFQDSLLLYSRDLGGSGNWGFVRRFKNSGYFALDGDLLAIPTDNHKAVKIFQRNLGGPDNWGLFARVRDKTTNTSWAYDVDLSGKTLVVGGVQPACGTFADFCSDGYRIFEQGLEKPCRWRRVLHVPGFGRDDTTGYRVAVDGATVLSSDGIRERGRGAWDLVEPLPSEVVETVHSLYRHTVLGTSAGKMIVFDRQGLSRPEWRGIAEIKQSGPSCRSFALGRRELLVGCPHAEFGRVKVYPRKPIFDHFFEASDLSGWARQKRRVLLASPGLDGSDQALAVDLDGTERKSFVRSKRLGAQPSVSLEITLLPNRVRLADETVDLVHLSGSGRRQAKLTLESTNDGYRVALWAWQRGTGMVLVGDTRVASDSETRLRAEWQRATGPFAGNGSARLLTGDKLAAERRDLANEGMMVSFVTVGLPAGSAGTEHGTLIFDDVVLHR